MTCDTLSEAESAVLHVIEQQPKTLREAVYEAQRQAGGDPDELAAAVYRMLQQGRIELDKQNRLSQVNKGGK